MPKNNSRARREQRAWDALLRRNARASLVESLSSEELKAHDQLAKETYDNR